MDDSRAADLHKQISDLQSILTVLGPVMPKLTAYLSARRDNYISQLISRNDEAIRGRIQEVQALIDLPSIIYKQIEYRTQEIERIDDGTTRSTGLDSIRGDFLQ